jgi:NAD-dependent SIR2 family protein deacetylase
MASERVLDGNVLAARLRDVFSFESTSATATCAHCGNRAEIGAWVVFADSPGMVARCPLCEKVQIRIVVEEGGRVWADLSGVGCVEIAVAS